MITGIFGRYAPISNFVKKWFTAATGKSYEI